MKTCTRRNKKCLSLLVVKSRIKTWTTDNCPLKRLRKILVLLKSFQISIGIHNSYLQYLAKNEIFGRRSYLR